MVKPVKNLHGLSPIEDWIQHSQYVEQQRDALIKRIERLRAELDYCVKNTNWECSYCHFHHQHRDCVYNLFLGDKNHIWDVIATDEANYLADDDKEKI